jgi:hypothetical protein
MSFASEVAGAVITVVLLGAIIYGGHAAWHWSRHWRDRRNSIGAQARPAALDSDFEHRSTGGSTESVRYAMYSWWRALLFGLAGFFALFAATFIVSLVRQGSAGEVAFFSVWLIGMMVLWRFYTYHVAMALTLSGETLTWRAALRTRRVNAADVVAVRPFCGWAAWGVIEAFELTDGSRLLVMVRKGLPEFARELARRRPGITVEFGVYSKMCERFRRQSGFSRDTVP